MFDAIQNTEMKQLVSDIEELLKASASLSLQQFFQQVVTKLGILAYIMKQPDKGWHMEVLTNLFNFVKDEHRKDSDTRLKNI